MTFSTVPFGIPKKYVINHIFFDISVVRAIMTFARNNDIFNRPFALQQNYVLNHIFFNISDMRALWWKGNYTIHSGSSQCQTRMQLSSVAPVVGLCWNCLLLRSHVWHNYLRTIWFCFNGQCNSYIVIFTQCNEIVSIVSTVKLLFPFLFKTFKTNGIASLLPHYICSGLESSLGSATEWKLLAHVLSCPSPTLMARRQHS
jgi:hypothetical protein